MPPIDAGIYGSAPRPQSVAELTNALLAQDANGLNNRLMAQKAQEYQAGVLRQQQVRNALAGLSAGANEQERIKVLEGTATPEGFEQADKMRKTLYERQKSDAEVGYKVAQTKKEGVETQGKSLENLQKSTAYAASQLGRVNVQDDNAVADLYSDLVGKGVLTRDQAISEINRIPAAGPARDQWKQAQQQSGLTMLEQINKQVEQQKIEEQKRQFGVTSTETNRSHRANEGIAGGHLALAREKEAREKEASATSITYQTDPDTGRVVALPTKAPAGAPLTAREVTIDGKPLTGKGGSNSKITDAKDVLQLLNQADPLIDAATSSYLGKGADEAARAFGASTPGAAAAAQLKALEGALVSKMPKMSGPQSDKDVLLYRQMAGQIGDSTVPAGTKRAAMTTIRELNERYAGMAPGSSKPGQQGNAPKQISSDADYNSLPSGAEFIAPDGSHRRKP